jgi:Flp pilus assembly protein TadG
MGIIRRDDRGAALVEFAIVVTLLIVLIFGIIEFGLLIKDYLTLNQAAREGARSAALGSPTSVVQTRIRNSAPTLDSALVGISLYKRTMSGSPGSWVSLGNLSDGSYNDAAPGNQVRVKLIYPHQLVTGTLFSWLAGGGSSMDVGSEMVMRRE